MEAIILAGGFGTRLQSVVRDVPKPMADINGRPFLAYIMDYLHCHGVCRVIMSVGYRHEIIKKYFGIKYNTMFVEYVTEEEPLGTGGAILDALRHLQGEDALVLNGDTFFAVPLKEMVKSHRSHNADITIALKPLRNFDRYGAVTVNGRRVTGFEGKSFREFGYINGGIYIMKKEIIPMLESCGRSFSLEEDFLGKRMHEIDASSFVSDGYFIDIGVPEDYNKAKIEMPALFMKGGACQPTSSS